MSTRKHQQHPKQKQHQAASQQAPAAAAAAAHVCEACGKPASFRCPKCSSLGLPPSYFCGQDCFKSTWVLHKVKHQGATKLLEMLQAAAAAEPVGCGDERFAGYQYTGPLRKHAVSAPLAVPDTIARPDYADEPNGFSACESRIRNKTAADVKTPEMVRGLREACRVAREVLDAATAAVRVGITTDELDKLVHAETVRRGAYPSPLHYFLFPKSVCTSVNEVVCHGIPDSRPLEDGDIVNIDVTCFYRGYHGDVNETVPVGTIDDRSKKLIEAAYHGMMRAIDIVRPGTPFRDIGNTIGRYVAPLGFSVDRNYCGHGIGVFALPLKSSHPNSMPDPSSRDDVFCVLCGGVERAPASSIPTRASRTTSTTSAQG